MSGEADQFPVYVAVLDCSDGNALSGREWHECHICTECTTVREIMEWSDKHKHGKRVSIRMATVNVVCH